MAITYYAGNRLTGVSGDTKPTTLPTGSTFLETNTDDLYLWDGDSWNIVASNTGTETLANKTFSDSLVFDEISAPGNAAADTVRLYAKSGGKLYSKDDAGNETDLTAGAGSTSTISGASDTDITSVASANILIYDGSNSWDNKAISGDITIATTGATTLGSVVITGQSAEATVNNANDYVLIYDGSASALKKMTVANLVAGGVSTDSLSALTDTTIASVASAQVLIYDGSDSWDNKTVSGDISINTSGVAAIGSGVILNADVNASAAIDYSKLAALSDGNILVGNGSNVAVSVNPSGDIDVTNAGVFSIASDVIVNADVKSDAAIAISKTALVAGTGITLATNTLNVDAAQTQITSVGALNAGSITSGFGAIDTGSSNITTTGTVSAGNLTVTGTTTTVNSTVLTVVDPIIHLQTASGGGALGSDTNKDVGLAMQYYSGSAKTAFLGFDDSAAKLTFIPDATLSSEVVSGSVGTIVANIEGNVTGNVTGDTSGSSGSTTGNAATATALQNARTIGGTSFDGSANIVPATITVADTTDTTAFVALFESATGDLAPKTDAGVTYNAGTGMLTATGFTGPLTGNASGTAATVTGAAQTAITSLGTLTALQVDNLNINTNTISSTAGTDLLITPLAGQQLILDGTIIIDAGVVTGATSITSTEFVGGGVGLTALNATQLTSGTIPAARIGNDSIDSQHYAAASIDNEHLADNAVDSAELAAGAVDIAHLSASGSAGSGTFLRGDNTWASSGGDLSFGGDTFGANKVIGSNDDYDLAIETNGTTRLHIDNGGNVGVGIITPGGTEPTGFTAGGTILEVGDPNNALDRGISIQGYNADHGLDIWADVSTGDVFFDSRGDATTYDFQFRTRTEGTPVNAMTIAGDGDVTITTGDATVTAGDLTLTAGNLIVGTAGKGIDFSASGETRAAGYGTPSSILDDYEQGTFTPEIRGTTGTQGSWATAGGGGVYTKIGNLVQITFSNYLSNAGSWTGTIRVDGLPFTNSGWATAGSISAYGSTVVDAAMRGAEVVPSVNHMVFKYGLKLDAYALYSEVATGSYFNVSACYRI